METRSAREFPLLMRELKAFGVRRRFYAIRTIPAVLALPVLMLAFRIGGNLSVLEGFGQFVGQLCLLFQLALVCAGAPIWAANAMSREKEQDTLPLLLLADIRGYDIILAKLAGAFGPVACLLFAVLPVMIIGTFVGAPVSVLAAHIAVMVAIGFLGAGAGLFAATLPMNAIQAATVALGVTFAYAIAASSADHLHPAFAGLGPLKTWEDLQFMTPDRAAVYGATAILPFAVGAAFVAWAWRRLPGLIAPAPAAPAQTRRRHGLPRAGVAARILLRSDSGMMSGIAAPWAKGLMALFFIGLGLVPVLGGLAIFLLLSFDIFGAHRRLRESSALDDLLLTPLTDRELARAMFVANAVRLWPVLPGLAAGQFVWSTYLSGLSPLEADSWWIIAACFVPVPVAALAHYLFVIALACALSIYLRGMLFQIPVAAAFYAIFNFMIYFVTAFASFSVVFALTGDDGAGAGFMFLPWSVAVLGPGTGLKALAAWVFYREFLGDFGKLVRVETGMGYGPAPGERW